MSLLWDWIRSNCRFAGPSGTSRWIEKNCRFDKRASVTFSPAESHRIAQPKNLISIGGDLVEFAIKSGMSGLKWDDIDPDGNDFDKLLGTLNFYIPQKKGTYDEGSGKTTWQDIPPDDRISAKEVRSLVDAFNRDKAGEVILQVGPTEMSNSRKTPVVRIKVVENKTGEYEQLPELNIAHANARMILQMLAEHGLPVDANGLVGEFSIDDYWTARSLLSQEAKQYRERPSSEDLNKGMESIYRATGIEPEPEQEPPQNPWEAQERERDQEEQEKGPKVKVIDPGMTLERIDRYLSGIDEIAQWIHDNGLPNRNISYV